MSKSKNYTITSLSSSLNQISKRVFTAASNTRIRGGYAPYTLVKSKKGDIEGKEEFPKFPFGRFGPVAAASPAIPESITAGESLVHWYKMNEGSTTEATDFGLAAESTDMTLAGGVTADETGPSAIGSPDAIKFDGTDGIGSAYVRSDGSNTALGTLFDSDTWSVSWWMKDTESSYPNNDWHHWIGCVDSTSWYWPRAWGLRYYFAQFAAWGYAGSALNVYSNIGAFSGASSWRNYVMTFNSSAGEFEGWINGTKNLTVPGITIDTSVGSETNMFLSIGGLKHTNGGVGQWTAPYFSDLRFYDIALSDANIASIYAGDWT